MLDKSKSSVQDTKSIRNRTSVHESKQCTYSVSVYPYRTESFIGQCLSHSSKSCVQSLGHRTEGSVGNISEKDWICWMSVYQSSKSSVQIKTQIEPVCRRIKGVCSSIKLVCSRSLWLYSSYRTESSTEQRYIAKLFIFNNYSGNWRTILLDCVTNESSLAFQGVSCYPPVKEL